VKRFNGICIISRDVQRLCDFYRDVLETSPEGGDFFAVLPVAGAALTLFAEQGMEEMAPKSMLGAGKGGYTIEIEVEDVDREHQRLTVLGVPIVKPPTTQPWGRRSVWFRDPDGNLVNFYTSSSGGRTSVKDTVREYFERLLNRKDLTVCDELLAANYQDHDAPPDTPPGPTSTREFVAGFLREYPDMRVTIEDLIADQDRVAARIVWRGNHRETGAKFLRTGVVVLKIDNDGKIAERWSAYEPVG
jgi:catechol 2,3-dioxygenase-like lactoylglutathione lyase family enzyme/predicted ester cyclase